MAEAMEKHSMSKDHRRILREQRHILETDLQAVQLLKFLTKILLPEDEESIKAEKTPTEQARALLDLLPKKGPEAFGCFVYSLWKVQPHLARALSKEAGLEEPSGIEESNKVILPQEMRSKLRSQTLRSLLKVIDLDQILKLMKVVFTKEDIELIKSKATADGKLDEFLSVLPRKGLHAFEHFVEVLEVSRYTQIANYLKGKTDKTDPHVIDLNPQAKILTSPLTVTVPPVHQTPISSIKDNLDEFYRVTNDYNGWTKLAQECQLLQENYRFSSNPTCAVITDWINEKGDMANVSALQQILEKHGLHPSRACLDRVVFSNGDNTDAPVDALVKTTGNLSIVPAKETTIVSVAKAVRDLSPDILSSLEQQINKEITDKNLSGTISKTVVNFDSIRSLTKDLRKRKLTETIKWMKANLPAGVTGPLLDEKINVRDMRYKVRCNLTVQLTVNHKWIELAERLKIDPPTIQYFKQQFQNPADQVLKDWETKSNSRIGDLYDLLVELELPVIADVL